LNNKVVYPLILLLYRDPGSVRIIFTDPDPKARDPGSVRIIFTDPDPKARDPDPHHWFRQSKSSR
jgi:hypothetical protein